METLRSAPSPFTLKEAPMRGKPMDIEKQDTAIQTRNIIVGGCARGGTTATANAFIAAGWDKGQRCQQVLNPNIDEFDGQRAFNEDIAWINANQAIFRRFDLSDMLSATHPLPYEPTAQDVQMLLEDKNSPWVLKDPHGGIHWPVWSGKFEDTTLVVPVREPGANIRSLVTWMGLSPLKAAQVWWRNMSLQYLWSQLFDDVVLVPWPEGTGLEALGADTSVFKRELIRAEPLTLGDGFHHLTRLYEKMTCSPS